MKCLCVAGNMTKCPLMGGVRLWEVSVSGGSTVPECVLLSFVPTVEGSFNVMLARQCIRPDLWLTYLFLTDSIFLLTFRCTS